MKKTINKITTFPSEIIAQLSNREQKIIKMRYGLVDGVEYSLEEVGREFDITRERVRQLEAMILEKIKSLSIKT